jgi:hypothetical protein
VLRHGHSSGAKQAAEKGLFWVKSGKKHTAGAEARIDSAVLTARLQSCRQFSRKMLGFSPCVSLISIVWLKPESYLDFCGTTQVVP